MTYADVVPSTDAPHGGETSGGLVYCHACYRIAITHQLVLAAHTADDDEDDDDAAAGSCEAALL
jgi:hypothetical protein